MGRLEELGLENYKDYLQTKWWKHLTHRLITLNPDAKCWICGKKSTLLPHHVSYENLGREKLGRDIYILCFSCHEEVHFTLFFHKKVLLDKYTLLKRMWFLKIIYPIRFFKLGSFLNSIWYRIS